jgi:hypothetical protein
MRRLKLIVLSLGLHLNLALCCRRSLNIVSSVHLSAGWAHAFFSMSWMRQGVAPRPFYVESVTVRILIYDNEVVMLPLVTLDTSCWCSNCIHAFCFEGKVFPSHKQSISRPVCTIHTRKWIVQNSGIQLFFFISFHVHPRCNFSPALYPQSCWCIIQVIHSL